MFDIQFATSSSNRSTSKSFIYTLQPGSGVPVTEKVPQQAQHIVELAYNLSLTQPIFTLNDLIDYIDECCAYDNTVFTRSKGGTERIVRYYSQLLQTIGALTDYSHVNDYATLDEYTDSE